MKIELLPRGAQGVQRILAPQSDNDVTERHFKKDKRHADAHDPSTLDTYVWPLARQVLIIIRLFRSLDNL